ncbi:hypothetical protein AB6G16_12155 [Proteus mirabilis]
MQQQPFYWSTNNDTLFFFLHIAGFSSLYPEPNGMGYCNPLVVTPPPMNFDGAADGTPAGTPITSTWIGETSVHNGFKCEKKFLQKCWVETLYANATGSKISGIYYYEGSNRYPVYSLPELKVSAMLLV